MSRRYARTLGPAPWPSGRPGQAAIPGTLTDTVTFTDTDGNDRDVVVRNGGIVSWEIAAAPGGSHPVSRLTRLTPLGLPGRRCGSFAGR